MTKCHPVKNIVIEEGSGSTAKLADGSFVALDELVPASYEAYRMALAAILSRTEKEEGAPLSPPEARPY
ncbi:hypothetical protein EON79_11040 [bacterium]|nr:MAG: hypothetical protein EON79_11040 [bacterium]